MPRWPPRPTGSTRGAWPRLVSAIWCRRRGRHRRLSGAPRGAAQAAPAADPLALLGQERELRAARPVGSAPFAIAPARAGRRGAAPVPRCARGVAPLRLRAAGARRPPRPPPGSARARAAAAGADRRVELLESIPGVVASLGLSFAVEIGELSRLASACKLVGYSGLTPERPAVGGGLPQRPALEGRLGQPARGGGRGGPARLARGQALAPPPPRRRAARPPPPSRRWRASCRSPPGTCSRARSASSLRAREAAAPSRQAPRGPWPPSGAAVN